LRASKAAAKLEGGKRFEVPDRTDSGTNLQLSFKKTHSDIRKAPTNMPVRPSANPLTNPEFEEWLGGRDSNPDNVVQSHVSYR
jgi:hypothetical protein